MESDCSAVVEKSRVGWEQQQGLCLTSLLAPPGALAGTAFVSGANGTRLSAGMGLAVAMPLLWYEYRHTGGWRAPFLFLVASAAMFMVSTLFLGDLLASPAEQLPIDVDQHAQH